MPSEPSAGNADSVKLLSGDDLATVLDFVKEVADESWGADVLDATARLRSTLDDLDLDARSWRFVLVPMTWGLGELAEADDLDAIADTLPPEEDHAGRLASILARAVRRGR